MNSSADLMIIGGGVLGAFHAYHALSRGLSVILLERNSAPQGATVRNFGQVVPSGMDLTWQRFGRESLEIYKSLQSKIDLSVRCLGSFYIASNDEEQTLLEELHHINNDVDYESEIWSADKCLKRFPQLRPDYCRAGLHFPQEVSVNPRVMIHQLHRYLKQQPKFESHFQTCVTELDINGSGNVVASIPDGRTFQANQAIVCSGTEFQLLFPDYFCESEMTAVKLQMLRLKPQPQSILPGNILTGLSIRRYESFVQCPSWESIKSAEAKDSFAKTWGIHILFKQEPDGAIILGDSHEYAPVDKFDTLDFELRTDINDYFLNEAAKIFDLPSWEVETSWAGVYSQTTRSSGIYTESIGDQIHLVTGIGGKGMTSSAGFSKYNIGEIYND